MKYYTCNAHEVLQSDFTILSARCSNPFIVQRKPSLKIKTIIFFFWTDWPGNDTEWVSWHQWGTVTRFYCCFKKILCFTPAASARRSLRVLCTCKTPFWAKCMLIDVPSAPLAHRQCQEAIWLVSPLNPWNSKAGHHNQATDTSRRCWLKPFPIKKMSL